MYPYNQGTGDQELLSLFRLEISRYKLLAWPIPYALTVLTFDLRAWAQSAPKNLCYLDLINHNGSPFASILFCLLLWLYPYSSNLNKYRGILKKQIPVLWNQSKFIKPTIIKADVWIRFCESVFRLHQKEINWHLSLIINK